MGGQLSKVICNQVKVKIIKVAKNSSWGEARRSRLPRGMIDTSDLDSIGAKIEAIMYKKLSRFRFAKGSSNVSAMSEVKSFSCRIYGGTNHDASYCWYLNSKHVAAVDYIWGM